MRIVGLIAAVWLMAFAASFALLRAIDLALTIPGAHGPVDALLAFFVGFPIALLVATTVAMLRGARAPGRPGMLHGRGLALAALAIAAEAGLVAAGEAWGLPALAWVTAAAWLLAMLGLGTRLADAFTGLR